MSLPCHYFIHLLIDIPPPRLEGTRKLSLCGFKKKFLYILSNFPIFAINFLFKPLKTCGIWLTYELELCQRALILAPSSKWPHYIDCLTDMMTETIILTSHPHLFSHNSPLYLWNKQTGNWLWTLHLHFYQDFWNKVKEIKTRVMYESL